MKLELNTKEIIPFEDFALSWRWKDTHSPDISAEEKAQIKVLSEGQSKSINKAIDYFERESNLLPAFEPTDWMIASSESDSHVERFRNELQQLTQEFNENVFISWNRSTVVYTTKEIFIKFWDDFCYPSSDDVTVISELTNWVLLYNHIEVGRLWKRKK